ncbi:hypothetical protein CPB83DRAFT_833317 [Crepidotus variabilis]|uniref:Uncharacterized protein n=1 Tax=Crepidotus variabilis TaxID=179855 RepID=A0A9P6EN38_9AGAR|nr:hypothetical protein CPB83DRAFT_833317 [Crepidotus variabilis]
MYLILTAIFLLQVLSVVDRLEAPFPRVLSKSLVVFVLIIVSPNRQRVECATITLDEARACVEEFKLKEMGTNPSKMTLHPPGNVDVSARLNTCRPPALNIRQYPRLPCFMSTDDKTLKSQFTPELLAPYGKTIEGETISSSVQLFRWPGQLEESEYDLEVKRQTLSKRQSNVSGGSGRPSLNISFALTLHCNSPKTETIISWPPSMCRLVALSDPKRNRHQHHCGENPRVVMFNECTSRTTTYPLQGWSSIFSTLRINCPKVYVATSTSEDRSSALGGHNLFLKTHTLTTNSLGLLPRIDVAAQIARSLSRNYASERQTKLVSQRVASPQHAVGAQTLHIGTDFVIILSLNVFGVPLSITCDGSLEII